MGGCYVIICITRSRILTPIFIWWLLFTILSIYSFNRFEVLNIVGFLFLTIVPGFLTILNIDLEGMSFWGYATITVGFSLLELMIIALLGNTFLPSFGIARPLDKLPVLMEIYFLVGILFATIWFRLKEREILVKEHLIFEKLSDFVFAFTPIIFVILSIFGAISLNNGGSDMWTMTMLAGMGVYILFLIIYAYKLDENVIPTSLFFMSLSLLLMTDLRGWFITGHDIQIEYKVFELAKNAGLWNIAIYRDAYNACLSITILPTIFFNMLSITDTYIYKFLFQILFALCAGLVYLIVADWEILNEPNLVGAFEPQPDAGNYVVLLKEAYATIKSIEPSSTVVTGGLGPAATINGNIAPIDFLTEIYQQGGKNYFDAVGDHPYSYPALPMNFETWNAWSQISSTMPSLRSVMVANGDASKAIWFTEYGAPTGGPGVLSIIGTGNDFLGAPDHVTEALQAQMLSQAALSVRNVSWAGPLFWYSYKDIGTTPNTNENFFGLIRYDGSTKPAYTTLKNLLQ